MHVATKKINARNFDRTDAPISGNLDAAERQAAEQANEQADGQASSAPEPAISLVAEAPSVDFLMAMLATLARMALKSSRRQADLQTAMRASGLQAAPGQAALGIIELERAGYVRNMLELSDGGILVIVTADGFDRLRQSAYRGMLSPTSA